MFDTLTESELIALSAKLDSAYETIRDVFAAGQANPDWKMATEINMLGTMVAATLYVNQNDEAWQLNVIA
jgi:hypothetical protein